MVSCFVCSFEWVHIVQLLQGRVQMATDYVRGGETAFPIECRRGSPMLSVANELFEKSGNRRVKVNLAKAVLLF